MTFLADIDTHQLIEIDKLYLRATVKKYNVKFKRGYRRRFLFEVTEHKGYYQAVVYNSIGGAMKSPETREAIYIKFWMDGVANTIDEEEGHM
jgi:hypothetical protein